MYPHECPTGSDFAGGEGEAFVDAAAAIRAGDAAARDFEGKLATVQETALVTAMLEAGRRSLDAGGRIIGIDYDDAGRPAGLSNG